MAKSVKCRRVSHTNLVIENLEASVAFLRDVGRPPAAHDHDPDGDQDRCQPAGSVTSDPGAQRERRESSGQRRGDGLPSGSRRALDEHPLLVVRDEQPEHGVQDQPEPAHERSGHEDDPGGGE